MTKPHLITDSTTWVAGDVAIYLAPGHGDTWEVEAVDMMGDVAAELETFGSEVVARRYAAELVKDFS